MPFSTFGFFLFFLLVVLVSSLQHHLKVDWRWRQGWLLAASLFFYGYARTANVTLLLCSIVFNWGVARLMTAQANVGRRKLLLWAGLTVNLILLFLFKYVNLFLNTIAY